MTTGHANPAPTEAPILDVLAERWSTRVFDAAAELDEAAIESALEAARWTPSASTSSVISPSIGGPPAWPTRVSASTSCSASSCGKISSQLRQVSVNPCRQTIGEPEPPR